MPLSIVTYNMQGFRAARVPYIAYIVQLFDIVLVQEHWLLESQFHVFEDSFPNTNAYCISAMNENAILYGRGFGGCAIIWKSSIEASFEPVQVHHKRACGVKISMSDVSLFLCSLYLPCDENVANAEYTDVLDEVFNSDVYQNVYFVIIGGDLNTDLARGHSHNTGALQRTCLDENVMLVKTLSDICDIDYTFESKANGTRSCIDHFIVSENLVDLIDECCVKHEGDNLSDNDAVYMTLSLEALHFSPRDSPVFHRPVWTKAGQDSIEAYKYDLDLYLNDDRGITRRKMECFQRQIHVHRIMVR